jgi:hypothetical protein
LRPPKSLPGARCSGTPAPGVSLSVYQVEPDVNSHLQGETELNIQKTE